MITKFICLCAISFSQADEILRHMTEDEVQRIFRVSRQAVPEYEIVPTVIARGAEEDYSVKIRAFNRNIELYLKPNNYMLYGVNTPVYSVFPDNSQPHGLHYSKHDNPFQDMGLPYQDVKTNSSVILNKEIDDSVHMTGTILGDHVIEPLPRRLSQIVRTKRSTRETGNNINKLHHHVIYRRPSPAYERMPRKLQGERRRPNKRYRRSTLVVPDVIHPEILAIMDYSLYETQNKNIKDALLYLLAYWNAVDLRYRSLQSPRVQLNIAAFIISIEPGGTPYFENITSERTLNAVDAVARMGEYLYNEPRFPFHQYDLAVAVTRMDLYDILEDGPSMDLRGYAYISAACHQGARAEATEAVAVVEDNGRYGSVTVAAHEVGHLLSAPHDGEGLAESCTSDEGFLMGDHVTLKENTFYWSKCSITQIRSFINSRDTACLFNVPQPGNLLRTPLPGELLSLNEQCEGFFSPTYACHVDESACRMLLCYNPVRRRCITYGPAAEGSYCGQNMHCLNGHCLSLNAHELVIPTEFADSLESDTYQDSNAIQCTKSLYTYGDNLQGLLKMLSLCK